jgi:hypothetical protein
MVAAVIEACPEHCLPGYGSVTRWTSAAGARGAKRGADDRAQATGRRGAIVDCRPAGHHGQAGPYHRPVGQHHRSHGHDGYLTDS